MAHGLKLLHGMWDLPGPGIEPVFPALAGGFLTTAPPGNSLIYFQSLCFCFQFFPGVFFYFFDFFSDPLVI